MTAATERDGPAPPVPSEVDIMSRDLRWFAYATGAERPEHGYAAPPARPDTEVAPAFPEAARGGARVSLPRGTTELLERVPCPHGRVTGAGDTATALGHALVAGFGLQRREPENPFNDHRPYPSVRAKFPVQVLVRDGGRRRVLDLYRHALTATGRQDGEEGAGGADGPLEVALAGRYTRLPDSYRWFRGTLVGLEQGINLRQLCLGLELFGLRGRLRLPGRDAAGLLADFGLTPTAEWSLPLVVEVTGEGSPGPDAAGEPRPAPAAGAVPAEAGAVPPEESGDPVLDAILAVNRAQDFAVPAAPIGPAVPAEPPRPEPETAPEPSWAEVLWRRSAGRMPRGMYGMSGRRRRVPERTLREAVRWLAVPPPGPQLAAAWAELRLTAVVQDVTGLADGVYRVHDGEPVLHRADPRAAAALEENYGYRVDPYNGGDIRHATAVWFWSARPRRLVERLGPGGFTAAQYAAGWGSQGVGLAAAATGLYARPARAFLEIPAQRLLGLEPDEMIVCAVITGTPRYQGLLCDLRL